MDLVRGKTDAMPHPLQFVGKGAKGKDVAMGANDEDANI
jgi:hypothetical protein